MLSFKKAKFYYSKLGQKSAFTTKKLGASTQTNHYKKLFRQGATLVPRNFYFIEPTQKVDGTFKGMSFAAKTSDASNRQAKEPWKDIIVFGRVSSELSVQNGPCAKHAALCPARATFGVASCQAAQVRKADNAECARDIGRRGARAPQNGSKQLKATGIRTRPKETRLQRTQIGLTTAGS